MPRRKSPDERGQERIQRLQKHPAHEWIQKRLEFESDLSDRRSGVIEFVIGVLRREIDRRMLSLPHARAQELRESTVHYEEYRMKIARMFFEAQERKIESIVSQNEIDTARIRECIAEVLPDILQKTLNNRTAPAEIGSIYARLLESRSTAHYDLLVRNAEVKSLHASDIEEIQSELYDPHLLTPEEALRLANGETLTTERTFVQPFDAPNHEKDEMKELLERTAHIGRRPIIWRKREKELMYVSGLRSQAKELLAVSVHTIPPRNPKTDKRYLERETEFIEKGVSGGGMNYMGSEKFGFREAILDGKIGTLYLIIGKAAGAARRVLSESLLRFEPGQSLGGLIDQDHFFRAYVLRHLTTYFNGIPTNKSPRPVAQNVGSMRFLGKYGYTAVATDEDGRPEASGAEFRFGDDVLRATPGWTHLVTSYEDALRQARAFREEFRSGA